MNGKQLKIFFVAVLNNQKGNGWLPPKSREFVYFPQDLLEE